tara:strand:- start:306 stop:593 length:288 start_codon:yes stop_codon:yes gene_type:complete
MSALINFSIDLTKISKDQIIEGTKGKYVNLTASINEESRFGNNVSFSLSQSKEQREAKEPKTYLGNGKVVWTDGQITLATKEEVVAEAESDDLPF